MPSVDYVEQSEVVINEELIKVFSGFNLWLCYFAQTRTRTQVCALVSDLAIVGNISTVLAWIVKDLIRVLEN